MKFFPQMCVFSLLLFVPMGAYSQEDSLEKRNLFKLDFTTCLGISVGRSVAGVWHKPNISSGISTKFGVSLMNNVWLNAGVTYDRFSYRSGSFVYWGVERFSERNMASVTFPLSVEYSSPKRIGWYAETGVSYGLNQKDEEINRRVDSKVIIQWSSPVVYKLESSFSNYSLFLNISGGFQYRNGSSVYQLGLAYGHVLANYDSNFWQRGIHAMRFEFGVQQELSGNRLRSAVKKTFDSRLKRKNYAYIELVGNAFMSYSINYERSLITRETFRLNTRFGTAVSLWQAPEKYPNMLLLGGLCSFGRSHSVELGLNGAYYSIIGGDSSDREFILIPTLGYRFEHSRGIFARLSFTPQIFVAAPSFEGQFNRSIFGISLGGHF